MEALLTHELELWLHSQTKLCRDIGNVVTKKPRKRANRGCDDTYQTVS